MERFQRGILVTNRVYWELKNFYPREYQVGQYGLEVVERYAQVKLPEEEAANIAFHIVNAQQEEASQYDAMRAAKLIRSIVSLVTYTLHIQADPNSLHYARFLSHLQYFTQRFYADKMLSDPTDFLYRQLYEAYPQIVECAERVRTYILREYGKAIPNEEVAYLAVHIQRLAARDA